MIEMKSKAENTLDKLAEKYQTDKGTKQITRTTLSPKGYTEHYEQELLHLREEENFTLIEIGINSGASLRMWREYFPNAHIVGMDIKDYRDSEQHKDLLDDSRVTFVCGHQGKQDDLIRLQNTLKPLPPVKIIIDDGSHKRIDQANSFSYLFYSVLSNGGFYAVEDLQADIVTTSSRDDFLLSGIMDYCDWHTKSSVITPLIQWIKFFPRMIMVQKS